MVPYPTTETDGRHACCKHMNIYEGNIVAHVQEHQGLPYVLNGEVYGEGYEGGYRVGLAKERVNIGFSVSFLVYVGLVANGTSKRHEVSLVFTRMN